MQFPKHFSAIPPFLPYSILQQMSVAFTNKTHFIPKSRSIPPRHPAHQHSHIHCIPTLLVQQQPTLLAPHQALATRSTQNSNAALFRIPFSLALASFKTAHASCMHSTFTHAADDEGNFLPVLGLHYYDSEKKSSEQRAQREKKTRTQNA